MELENKHIIKDGQILVCSWFVHHDVVSAVLEKPNLMHFFFMDMPRVGETFVKRPSYEDVAKKMLVIHPTMLLYFMTDMFNLVRNDDAVKMCTGYDNLKLVNITTDKNIHGEDKIVIPMHNSRLSLDERKEFVLANTNLIERFVNRKNRYAGDFEFGYKIVKLSKE